MGYFIYPMVFYGPRYDWILFYDIVRGSESVKELCVNVKGWSKEDLYHFREFMWENGRFIKFNVYESDDFAWFVRVYKSVGNML